MIAAQLISIPSQPHRGAELLETDGFFKGMKGLGCEVVRILNDCESSIELLSRFVGKRPSVMHIQQELFEGKSVAESAAAAELARNWPSYSAGTARNLLMFNIKLSDA